MTFQEAERQYAALSRQWQAREITPEQFQDGMKRLRLQASDGTWWQIRGRDGQWLRWTGGDWIEETPPNAVPPPPPPSPDRAPPADQTAPATAPILETRRRRGCLRSCLLTAVILACVLGALGAGGYYLVQSGRVSALQLQAQLSSTASVSVYNLVDEPVIVRLTQLDGPDGPVEWDSEQLEPYDSGSYGAIPTGRLEVAFVTNGTPASQTCTLQTERGDSYRFVIVPEGVAIAAEGVDQTSAEALKVATSELCQ